MNSNSNTPKSSFLKDLMVIPLILVGKIKFTAPEVIGKLIEEGAFLLDVRKESQVKKNSVPDATNIPLGNIIEHLSDLPKDKKIIVFCNLGGHAEIAKRRLEANGFKVYNAKSWKVAANCKKR